MKVFTSHQSRLPNDATLYELSASGIAHFHIKIGFSAGECYIIVIKALGDVTIIQHHGLTAAVLSKG